MSRKRILLFAVLLVALRGRVLLLWRKLDTQGTAASCQFFVGRSDSSEDRVQRFGILYPHR